MANPCENSIILIDKPSGITSFDVIKKIKRITGIKKVGHSGVLDKTATGLLVCATNRATKLLNIFENGYKIYEAEILFGVKTDTYDISGRVVAKKEGVAIDPESVKNILTKFTGEIIQQPPVYSNIKIEGKRSYQYAANNKNIEMPKRKVIIHDITLIEAKKHTARLRIKCSKGTYIRTLANDMGEKLGTYGCIKSLRRIFSEPFSIEQADKIENMRCLSVNEALSFLPSIRVEDRFLNNIKNGVDFCKIFDCNNIKSGFYRIFAGNRFSSIVEKKKNNKAIYRFIFPNEQI